MDSKRPPDIVVIVVDTLRADSLGCYGSSKGLTPTMDALAERGTRFARALSSSSWTVPAVASLVTGLHPQEHGVEEGGVRALEAVRQPVLAERFVTIAERFRTEGYATAGVMTNPHLTASLGFAQGFEQFHALGWARSEQVVDAVEQSVNELGRERPRFFWIHLFDPHHPYRPFEPPFLRLVPSEWSSGDGEQRPGALAWQFAGTSMAALEQRPDLEDGGVNLPILRAAYESEVAHTDAAIERILEIIAVEETSIVVVTADHGEEFRDHGRLGHRHSLYAELVRVPFILASPAPLHLGDVVSKPVSMLDLYPTLVELAGFSPQADISGTSLVQGNGFGGGGERMILSTVLFQGKRMASAARVSYRLILDESVGTMQLFNETWDAFDREDIAMREPVQVQSLRTQLEEQQVSMRRGVEPRRAPLTPETVEQLRRLGYLTE